MIKHFPSELGEPRQQQIEVLEFVESGLKRSDMCVAEMPTGAGKSGVAIAVCRSFGGGFVVTNRVALQRQYCDEFQRVSPLLGRANFPCLKLSDTAFKSIPIILDGKLPNKPALEFSCASAPCLNRPSSKQQKIKTSCNEDGGCPHETSIIKAQESEVVIANFHSLIYSVALSEKVQRRKVIVFDEAHDLQKSLRQFMSVKFKIRRKVLDAEIVGLKTTEQWYHWLLLPDQTMLLRDEDQRDSWKARLEKLVKAGNTVQNTWTEDGSGFMFIEFVPTNVMGAAKTLLFSLAEKVVFLSGTFFGREDFLKPLGVDPDITPYIRVASDFPVQNRPVYLPKKDARDLSFKGWKENFGWMIDEVKGILAKYPNEKGLIHTNSYRASQEIQAALKDERLMFHTSENFVPSLQLFYDIDEPRVFVSPTVGEGYSFDDDLARFQIILTPKYEPSTDAYIKYLLDNGNWKSYRYEAQKVLAQQCGRIVRSKSDWGHTFLVGSGFNSLLKNTWKTTPAWQREGFAVQ